MRLSNNSNVECRAICDSPSTRIGQYVPVLHNWRPYQKFWKITGTSSLSRTGSVYDQAEGMADENARKAEMLAGDEKEARAWAEWADLSILAPIDTDTLARMTYGLGGSTIASILRSWDVGKRIIVIPGMSRDEWKHPLTAEQLGRIQQKWSWISVSDPIIWHYEDADQGGGRNKVFLGWKGLPDVIGLVSEMVSLRGIGDGEPQSMPTQTQLDGAVRQERRFHTRLPNELWSLIFTHLGDWEIAQNLGIYTQLPIPPEWALPTGGLASQPNQTSQGQPLGALTPHRFELEMAAVAMPVPKILELLDQRAPSSYSTTPLFIKLIIKFDYVPVLTKLLERRFDRLLVLLQGTILPHKASATYNRPKVLEWWKTHTTTTHAANAEAENMIAATRSCGAEAIDGASRQGFIEVLDWWRRSGLCMKYTEAALEQASARGLVNVLEWWNQHSIEETKSSRRSITHSNSHSNISGSGTASPAECEGGSGAPLRLKVGKSILAAAQGGHADVVRWWVESGIPYSHEEGVAKVASAYGHVKVLEVWKEALGDKFATCYDNQVLVGPTKNGFARVLEWWRRQTLGDEEEGGEKEGGKRLKVEYKTCDIEEALEDSVNMEGSEGEEKVREWWGNNGLNLGVATGEWMETKTL